MFIVLLILVPSVFIVMILLLFGKNKIDSYDCHITGCNASFETMTELIDHLIYEHGYKIDCEDYVV